MNLLPIFCYHMIRLWHASSSKHVLADFLPQGQASPQRLQIKHDHQSLLVLLQLMGKASQFEYANVVPILCS